MKPKHAAAIRLGIRLARTGVPTPIVHVLVRACVVEADLVMRAYDRAAGTHTLRDLEAAHL